MLRNTLVVARPMKFVVFSVFVSGSSKTYTSLFRVFFFFSKFTTFAKSVKIKLCTRLIRQERELLITTFRPTLAVWPYIAQPEKTYGPMSRG